MCKFRALNTKMSKTCPAFYVCMYMYSYICHGRGRDISSQIYKIEYDKSHKRNKNIMLNIFGGV